MAKAWESNVRRVVPYVPGEQPKVQNIIKLNTNENPYPPAPRVKELIESMDYDKLRLYPDPEATVLVDALAKRYGVERDQVFVGVGSDDVIAMAFLTFFNSKKPIIFPEISYSFYSVWADLYRIPYVKAPLDKDFKLVKEEFLKENGGIIFPNPNAPTAIAVDLTFIEDVVKANPDVVVIVDEAYIDFGGVSALPLIEKYDNLLVVQTFSKSRSMAGTRIGYALGQKELIKALSDVKFSFNSYTMNQASLAVGAAAVEDEEYFQSNLRKVIETRTWAKAEFEKLGFTCTDSSANFLFVTHKSIAAKEIFEALKAKNIFVRYFSSPKIDNHLRVTIGTDDEMKALFEALKSIVEA